MQAIKPIYKKKNGKEYHRIYQSGYSVTGE